MKCPKKSKLISYANSTPEVASEREAIQDHLGSCRKCRDWLETYQALQETGDILNPYPEQIPEYRTPAVLQHAPEQVTEPLEAVWWASWRIPTLAFGSAILLLLVAGLVYFQWFRSSDGVPFSMQGQSFLAWGDTEQMEELATTQTPPALQAGDRVRHVAILNSELAHVLKKPGDDQEFWTAFGNALNKQRVSIPSFPQTFIIENSLLQEIQTDSSIATQAIWVMLYGDHTVLLQWAEE